MFLCFLHVMSEFIKAFDQHISVRVGNPVKITCQGVRFARRDALWAVSRSVFRTLPCQIFLNATFVPIEHDGGAFILRIDSGISRIARNRKSREDDTAICIAPHESEKLHLEGYRCLYRHHTIDERLY